MAKGSLKYMNYFFSELGADRNEAMSRAQVRALQVMAERMEHGEAVALIHSNVDAGVSQ